MAVGVCEMACFFPIPAWRSPAGGVSLREPLVRRGDEAFLRLPCGSCIGCRMSRAREWALRCSLELQAHSDACWATLTYDDAHLPPTLAKGHVSGWLKRLRARVAPVGVRFFASGEYGERTARPHYHSILFGVPESAPIQDCWPYGFARVDPLSPAAISYVAGYCSKKVGWKLEAGERIDYSTGEIYEFQPPFVLMSRRPGIGGAARDFWRSWRSFAVWSDVRVPVPRFLHASWLLHATPEEVAALEVEQAARPRQDSSKARLVAGAAIAAARHGLNSERRLTL